MQYMVLHRDDLLACQGPNTFIEYIFKQKRLGCIILSAERYSRLFDAIVPVNSNFKGVAQDVLREYSKHLTDQPIKIENSLRYIKIMFLK